MIYLNNYLLLSTINLYYRKVISNCVREEKDMNIAENIRYLRKKAGMNQEELAAKLGYRSFTTIQKWESGVSTPPIGILARMAALFEVDLDDFARTDLSSGSTDRQKPSSVPVFGKIPAGVPVEAIEDIDGFTPLPEDLAASGKDYFSLRIKGDSMYPKYLDGDIVLFERADVCENGDDCAVRIGGGDATFKKIKMLDHSIILQPMNPEYDPVQIDGSAENVQVEILGIAREIRRKV